jgi:hypothetical protein
MKSLNTWLLVLIAFLSATWCVGFPFYWAHSLSISFGMSYITALHVLFPHIILASLVACCLLLAGFRKHIAVIGFIFAAVLAPILTFGSNYPASDAWFISTPLLLVLAWRYRSYLAEKA